MAFAAAATGRKHVIQKHLLLRQIHGREVRVQACHAAERVGKTSSKNTFDVWRGVEKTWRSTKPWLGSLYDPWTRASYTAFPKTTSKRPTEMNCSPLLPFGTICIYCSIQWIQWLWPLQPQLCKSCILNSTGAQLIRHTWWSCYYKMFFSFCLLSHLIFFIFSLHHCLIKVQCSSRSVILDSRLIFCLENMLNLFCTSFCKDFYVLLM